MADKLLGLPERRWLKLALALNFQPCRYVHESWYATLPQSELIQRLRDAPAAAAHINRYMQHILALDRRPLPDDFSHWRARLALLDGPALTQLSLFLGLALRSEELRNELLGVRLRRFRQALGDEAFTFVLKRAPFLGMIPHFPFEPDDVDPHIRFPVIGARYCIQQVAQSSPALARRMVFKLPQGWAGWITQVSTVKEFPDDAPSRQNQRIPPPLLRKLIKERLPPWNPLFT